MNQKSWLCKGHSVEPDQIKNLHKTNPYFVAFIRNWPNYEIEENRNQLYDVFFIF